MKKIFLLIIFNLSVIADYSDHKESEIVIKESINNLSKNKTTLIIAHRLSTVRNADIIAVLHKGQISETGTHESLLEEDGIYSRLWAVQTGE